MMTFRSNANRLAIDDAIEDLEYLNKFSKYLVEYLELEWPQKFDFSKNLNKNPKTQPCWNRIFIGIYKVISEKATPPYKHTEACKYIAEFLACAYPLSWSGDTEKNAQRIRARIDRIIPTLAKK